ncbi:MAG: pyruvate kinase [Firmicutes bacterium]|nr:pyruvate kinase [Bacillota bacterium]
MRRSKIVATIGPASEDQNVLVQMIEAGMSVARLNMSHGNHEEHARRLEAVRQAARTAGHQVGLMLDLKGPEIRIGIFPGGKVQLAEGQTFTFTTRSGVGRESAVSVAHPGLVHDVEPGATLLLDDGNLVLEAVAVTDDEVRCRVVVGGVLSDHKKINLPGANVSLPPVSEQDVEDIRFAVAQGVDFIAASFVRDAASILSIREIAESAGGKLDIIAKIESQQGVQNVDEILGVADGLMVARGDLGVEVPTEDVPLLQKRLISRCNELGKPVITATQMLESMITHPRPTRAEASDVANAIFDGTDAIMLSAETAAGKYPVDAVRVMARIAEKAETALDYVSVLSRRAATLHPTVTDAISHATVTTATDLGAAAILTATQSGHTARMVSKYRPQAPIIAVVPNERVAHRLSLVWGTSCVISERALDTDELMERATQAALSSGVVKAGDLVVITAGVPVGTKGTTNLLKVQTVGEVLIKGVGIAAAGVAAAVGRACVALTLDEAKRAFAPGDILVTAATDRDWVPLMEKARAVVTEEGGLTSHAAVAGISLGIPVVVGATDATGQIAGGTTITIDGARGLVYRGEARVL